MRFDDPRTAVEAVASLLEDIEAAGLPTGHAGIAAGRIVQRDGDIYGRTVNLAARISGHAEAGQLLVDDEVAEVLADRAALTAAGSVALQGFADPVALWSVRAIGRAPRLTRYHRSMPDLATIVKAPKALLHDHLDGGLRPATVIDLAAEYGYDAPADDRRRRPRDLVPARRRPQEPRALPRDLRPHVRGHAVAGRDPTRGRGMRRGPRRRRRRLRRGPDGARAVHRAGPDPRRGDRGDPRRLPDRLDPGGRGRPPDHDEAARHGDAPGRPLGRGRRMCDPLARRGRRRVRRRRAGEGLSADALSRCLRDHPAGQFPHHDPRRRVVRAAVDLGGAPVRRRRAARSRRADRRRHHRPRRRLGRARAAGGVRPRPARAARDVPELERPHRRRRTRSATTRSTSSAASATGSRSTPTTA